MKKFQESARGNYKQAVNQLKDSGCKISRGAMYRDHKRFIEENESAIQEAKREQKVLQMKKHYLRKGWTFPPKQHPHATIVHLINGYYGKEVCKHTPKDELEEKLNV